FQRLQEAAAVRIPRPIASPFGVLIPAVALTLGACGGTTTLFVTPTATPRGASSSAGASASASASPGSPTLDITQFGFHMTIPRGITSGIYSIDNSTNGAQQDGNGQSFTTKGIVNLKTPEFTQDCGSDAVPGSVEVDVASASSLSGASYPTDWKRAGQYLLGFRAVPGNALR
ncbi:MAG: hypothetical protein ABR498_04170, partial [Candidatus Dormibacteria bacterium]